ncbi:Clavaminate synthase-like protein [Rhizopogon vinicolor AM-OR11-026]|uniref:Clavaminate synthase-like protein n=1 Tax=Rhizopogon vinicolor AM-OR11-026 TaxID=1314800 RepID=A0A1B7N0P9_9AGAM|nr:Clavaminate synthase-like protein [Rhizopogon vinicolor AM-OR11-026]
MSLAESASATNGAFQDIPVIDLSSATSPNESERKALAQQIRDACMNVGFFYVKNHGIPPECIDDVLEVSKEYYSLPIEEKMKLHHKSLVTNFRGYSPLLDANIEPGNAGDNHEGFEFSWEELVPNANDEKRHDGAMAGANVWPERPEGYREAMLKYYHAAIAVGKMLFPLFALSLNLPERYFDDKTRNSAALMNALHYPPQTGPVDDRVVGIGAHTDFECFTILWQQPGIQALQVLNSEKIWINAPPIEGTLVINLGDQFTRWTNDIFKSTVHRAVNRNGVDRYSIPLFFGTDYDVNIEPIASCVSAERPARYEPITAGEYVNQRLKAMYY